MVEHTSPEWALPNKTDSALSVEEEGTPNVGKIGASDRPSYGVALHPAGARRSYKWKGIDLHYGSNGQTDPDKNRFSTDMERRQPLRKGSSLESGASASMGKGKEPQMTFEEQPNIPKIGKGNPNNRETTNLPPSVDPQILSREISYQQPFPHGGIGGSSEEERGRSQSNHLPITDQQGSNLGFVPRDLKERLVLDLLS